MYINIIIKICNYFLGVINKLIHIQKLLKNLLHVSETISPMISFTALDKSINRRVARSANLINNYRLEE